jgi:hypothetical protein
MRRLILVTLALMAAPAAAQDHSQHQQQAPAAPAARQAGADEHASAADRAAVLAVVDRLFAALGRRDRAALLAEVVPEGRATANLLGASRRVITSAWPEFADRLAGGTERLAERLVEPHVHVAGDIAMIWSRYEFDIDGRFSHCGIDHFDLVRMDGRWRVLNLTWTQQREGCPGR